MAEVVVAVTRAERQDALGRYIVWRMKVTEYSR
jgi:hypothetical protein